MIAQKYTSTDQVNIVKEYNGIKFSSERTLLENLNESADFETFSSMIEAHGTAIFTNGFMATVFVIEDSSFPDDSEEELTSEDQNRILRFHIVPGRLDKHAISKAIEKNGGTASFATLSGEKLKAKVENGILKLIDQQGNTATIVATNFYHQHGFFHVINGLLQPTEAEK